MSTSKIFAVLVIQSVLLLFLGYKVVVLENRTVNSAPVQSTPKSTHFSNDQPSGYEVSSTNYATREETRQIIQEEMDVLGERLLEAINKSSANAGRLEPRSRPQMTTSEVTKLNSSIEGQINSFISQGAASQAEMAKLEQMIASLPPGERLHALRELNKAVNSGRFDVKF